MKYHIIIFGCQMNISDAERVASVLESAKYKLTSNMDEADLIVVTMCSIRQSAVDRVHGLVEKFRKLKTINYKLQTILTGCVLKKDKKVFVKGFNYIIDIKDIRNLSRLLGKKSAKAGDNYLDITPKYSSKFSANVPIMTGCNNFCAYCVVPYAREREISRDAKEIISEIKNLVKKGYKEVWLLGQNVNSYRDAQTNFSELLKQVNNIHGEFWVRFTSSHPKDFNDEVIDAMALGGKITPYLNLPIQSGDDKVLKSMNRHYTVKDYKNKIKKLREKIPGIAISTDIIVGFPGETKKQFENTVKLFRDVKYDMAYINKYSSRAGTAAAKLKDNVLWEEKKRREKVLSAVLKQIALEINTKLVGKETLVLIDSHRGENWFGKNEYYKTIKIKSNKNILGKLVKVKITEASPFTLNGELIK
jgi:tRNA-2-methylthio-N6-dimethylallyladenosine synthase